MPKKVFVVKGSPRGQGNSAVHTFGSIFGYIGWEIVGFVHGSADAPGEIKEHAGLMQQSYELGKRLGGMSQVLAVQDLSLLD